MRGTWSIWTASAVQLVEYPSASEVSRAFRNQAIDGMVISLDELFVLAVDGLQPKIVVVVDVSHGADVVVGRSGMRTMKDLRGKRVAVESGALGAFVLSRALALNGMQASDVSMVHLESNEHPAAFEQGQVDGAVTFDPYRTQLLGAGAHTLFDSSQIPGEIVDLLAVRASVLEKNPRAVQTLLTGWFKALDYLEREPKGRRGTHGRARADNGRAVPAGIAGSAHSLAGGQPEDACRCDAESGGLGAPADDVDGGSEAPAQHARNRGTACARAIAEIAAVTKLLPASLKVTVPLVLLGFAVALSALNLIYQVPRAERAVEEDHRERLLQELSRLQSTLEYLLLKGDIEGARREVAILASNRNYTVVALTDDQHMVIAATRRAWLGRPAAEVLPKFDSGKQHTPHQGVVHRWFAKPTRMPCSATPISRWVAATGSCEGRASAGCSSNTT